MLHWIRSQVFRGSRSRHYWSPGLARILDSLKLDSMEKIDNLETLKEIVLKIDEIARQGKPNL
jgi:hypothetical protein